MRRLLGTLLFVGLSAALHATVIVPIEFRELVTTAPVIVHGHVVDVRSRWVDGRRSLETFVTVEAVEYLKGDLGPHLTFRVPGGEMGRYRTVFVGAPAFSTGDEVVLFLKRAGAANLTIVGLSQGAFRVVADARTGGRVVTTPVVMGNRAGEPQAIVRGDVTRKPLPIDAFRDVVRQVIASGKAQ
jgi:hypothetical protein